MNYINAIIFGITQGLTEFLPISSSGHLVILHEFVDLPIKDTLTFDIVLHFSTLLAVVLFFRSDILKLLKSWFISFSGKTDEYSRLAWLIILATIPAMLAGLFLGDWIESTLRSSWVVVLMLVLIGALFIVFERLSFKTKIINELNWKNSLIIGLAQAVALIPGTSRSGMTIIAGLGAGLKREAAIKFSFLLSIPIILGASVKKIPGSFGIVFSNSELLILFISFFTSFFVGILTIKYFLKFGRTFSLDIFAYYRFALAIIIILFLL